VAWGPLGMTTLGDHEVPLLWETGDTPTPPLLLEQSTCFHRDKRRVPVYVFHFKSVKVKTFKISELAEDIHSLCSLPSGMNPLCANREKQPAKGLAVEAVEDRGDSLEIEGIGLDFEVRCTAWVRQTLAGASHQLTAS
jgi:hypothetical protein